MLGLAAAAVLPTFPGFRSLASAALVSREVTGRWSPVPLISADTKRQLASMNLPTLGGEGGQWIRDVAFGPDGKTAIWGTDVGGLYRSLDGGFTWEPCNIGYFPRGTNCVAIDPRDASRIIAIGANTIPFDRHGVYLSTDRGASWRNVLSARYAGVFDERTAVVFDPSSDRVYWSRTAKDKASWGEGVNEPALYVSDDRGETWRQLPDSDKLGGAFLAHNPTQPILYVGGLDGIYEVRDGGTTVEKVSDLVLTGLDVAGDRLLGCTEKRIMASDDGGRTWTDCPGTSAIVRSDTTFRRLRVSPADGHRFGLYHERPDYNWTRIVTHDGGETFVTSDFKDELNFLPRNVRQPQFAWHATDPDIVLASGGDWPCRSDDGGVTFRWSGGGVNNIYCATAFQFCPDDPDVLFISSQDYNGGVTGDGGETWQYTNVSGLSWGGFTYGSASASRDELFCGLSGDWGGGRILATSDDGGATWKHHEDLRWGDDTGIAGIDNCLVDPDNAANRFAGPYRSSNAGKTWQRMSDCDGVWSAGSGMIFGVKKYPKENYVLASVDGGETWQRVARPNTGDIKDFAYDLDRDRLYMTADKKLWKLDGFRRALSNGSMVEPEPIDLPDVPHGLWTNELHGVAVDPRRPEVVYLCRHSNVFSHPASALRSTDAGKTWRTLARNAPLASERRDAQHLDGGRETMRVRVHPTTGDAWFTTGCYGIWKWSKASA
jgi:photosystem II stability/assembly factor-like uncharacterized protein